MRNIHKPCLASAAVTSSAKVASWGDSSRLMLPDEETLLSRRGDATLDLPGDCVMISAPWSTRALACSLKFNFWLSICLRQASVLVNSCILTGPYLFLHLPGLTLMTSIHLCYPHFLFVQVYNLGPILMKSISEEFFFKKTRLAHNLVSYLDITTSRYMMSIIKRTNFSLGLFFEI